MILSVKKFLFFTFYPLLDDSEHMFSILLSSTKPVSVSQLKNMFRGLSSFLLILMTCMAVNTAAFAQAWKPSSEPNIADDVGNWTSVNKATLDIEHSDIFSGLKTTRFTGSEAVTSTAKLYHPQHVVRLPNSVAEDGTLRAYFAVTQSWRFWSYYGVSYHTSGYLTIIEMDADALDPVHDVLINTLGKDGKFVYEEVYSDNRDRARSEYEVQINANPDAFVISNIGDWGHPAKMVSYGNLLMMVGQTWQPLSGAEGNSLDAIVFYDVSNPKRPKYLGKLDSQQLDVLQYNLKADGSGELSSEGVSLPYDGWRKIDKLGMTKTLDGYYHMSVMEQNYYCHEDNDCFASANINSGDIAGPAIYRGNYHYKGADIKNFNGWVQDPHGKFYLAAAQGEAFRSREIYAEAPLASEPCYDENYQPVPTGEARLGKADHLCAPPGAIRTMEYYGRDNRWVDSAILNYSSGTNEFFPVFYGKMKLDYNVNSTLEDIIVQGQVELGHHLISRKDITQDTDFEKKKQGYRQFFSQPAGACASSGGLYVTDSKEPVIYCPSEETGQHNVIYQNRADSAPSYGAIKFTDVNGRSVIYRGRGMPDSKFLSAPPWSNGEFDHTQIMKFQVLSGAWDVYFSPDYVATYFLSDTESPDDWHGWTSQNSYPPRNIMPRNVSFRAIPERGITLYDGYDFTSRSLNTVGSSNDSPSRSCGDHYYLCDVAFNDVGIFDTYNVLRFLDEANSYRVHDGSWNIWANSNRSGQTLGPLSRGAVPKLPSNWIDALNDVSRDNGVCPELAKPVNLQPVPGESSFRWDPVSHARLYEVEVSDINGYDIPGSPNWSTGYPKARMDINGVLQRGHVRVRARSGTRYECDGPWSRKLLMSAVIPLRLLDANGDRNPVRGGSVTIENQGSDVDLLSNRLYETVVLRAIPDGRSVFEGWSGAAAACGTNLVCELTLDPFLASDNGAAFSSLEINIQPIFKPAPSIIVEQNGNALKILTTALSPLGDVVTGQPCGTGYFCEIYPEGTIVTLLADLTSESFRFKSWVGDADCSDGVVTMLKSGSVKCRPSLERKAFELIITPVEGASLYASSATAEPIKLVCDEDCRAYFPIEDGPVDVTLTLVLENDYEFERWAGNGECHDQNMAEKLSTVIRFNPDKSKSVRCAPEVYPSDLELVLTVEKIGLGFVTATAITPDGKIADSSGISCDFDVCTQSYPRGTEITLTATPIQGSTVGNGFDTYFASQDGTRWFSGRSSPQGPLACYSGEMTLDSENLRCRAQFRSKGLIVLDTSRQRDDYSLWQSIDNFDLDVIKTYGFGSEAPTFEKLSQYPYVYWLSGPEKINAGPSPAEEEVLADYLDGGGCLLFESAEYTTQRGASRFLSDYFGVDSVNYNSEITPGDTDTLTGSADLTSEFNTLGPYFAGFEYTWNLSINTLEEDENDSNSGVLLVSENSGAALAVGKNTRSYRSAFFSFPLISVNPAYRSEIGTSFYDFCNSPYADDNFEPNEIRDDATSISGDTYLTNLKLNPVNIDMYKWSSQTSENIVVKAAFRHSDGDISLAVHDANYDLIAESKTQLDQESIEISNVVPDAYYYLTVFGAVGQTVDYELQVEIDNDRDNDGVDNQYDAFPDDPNASFDTDLDGISNQVDDDDDGDGIPDVLEMSIGLDPLINDATGDLDGDGVSNLEEYLANTDLQDPASVPKADDIVETQAVDSDSDGLSDVAENEIGTDPLRIDTDGDGISDYDEVILLSDPLLGIDTDNDGAPDACDAVCVSLGMTADTDDDNDGILDLADAYPLIAIGTLSDTDNDGAPDACDAACVALGMAADTDDDNDGVLDVDDAFPLDPTKSQNSTQQKVKNDVDGDGNSDLLWRSEAKGWNFLWSMDGVKTKQAKPINVVQDDGWL
ncbi:MAG: hypothetical protein ACI95X_001925, partial [Paraglaciecola sp.]